ncbi:Imm40 family immunity protein [Erwinia sp. MMLR14_017]|uniref:Imm40 family immunity protein n=1 Tax=Erwinia sp. MMLR14_017 TaxID=3093842 RepID=UPI00299077BC|nr:Imm40 family immunity protein [Erwinia sp. MMLR14_017]MDW8848437.1 Imm40 family immunity protein [Erwinia sp. MMLR14_017]
MINKILELYSRCGKSLLENGIHDAALPISVVNEALQLFADAKWTVLGGDVYQHENNKMNNFYADWYCNLAVPSESCDYAREHLSKLRGDNIYVSFTIKN